MSDPISELVAHFGSQTATAKALGVSQPTVSYWVSGHQKISPEKALRAQIESNGAVSASDLCPLFARAEALQTLNKSSVKNKPCASGPDGSVHPSSGLP
ncbi:Cro/CI family transcriptional regulator [Pseudomonas sp. G.S.17]|uniref:transcriptional regulator n=1 Tax=Pseudomonas sp. G.S.17 TaxID=3137451 RepID=UPI00311CBEB6